MKLCQFIHPHVESQKKDVHIDLQRHEGEYLTKSSCLGEMSLLSGDKSVLYFILC